MTRGSTPQFLVRDEVSTPLVKMDCGRVKTKGMGLDGRLYSRKKSLYSFFSVSQGLSVPLPLTKDRGNDRHCPTCVREENGTDGITTDHLKSRLRRMNEGTES